MLPSRTGDRSPYEVCVVVSRLDQKYFVPKFAHGDVVEELRHATQDPIKRIAHDAECVYAESQSGCRLRAVLAALQLACERTGGNWNGRAATKPSS